MLRGFDFKYRYLKWWIWKEFELSVCTISYPISIDFISYKRQGIATQYYYAANMHIQPITGADVLQSGVFKCNIQTVWL